MSGYALNDIGHENLTVGVAAVALTGVTDNKPTHALITVQTAPIRWRADGTAPTATTGQPVKVGERIDWTDVNGNYRSFIERVQFIRDTTAGADATLAVQYFQ